jgi:hypothetical protein
MFHLPDMSYLIVVTISENDWRGGGAPELPLPNGLYAWLLPCFEAVARLTKKVVDPFETVAFKGEELDTLEAELKKAGDRLTSEPDEIEVCIGVATDAQGSEKKVSGKLEKREIMKTLVGLLELIEEARTKNKFVLFQGQ